MQDLSAPKCKLVEQYKEKLSGKMTLTENGQTTTREGDMIYEFVYMGMSVKELMEH